MSTSDQLPVVANGGAVTVQPAGAVQVDSVTVAGVLGGPALDRGRPPGLEHLAPRQLEILSHTAENVWNELAAAAAVTPAQVEYARPVLAQYASLFLQARRDGDRAELRRLAHNLGCDLVVVGALTVQQRELMRPILARFNPRAAELLRSLPISRQPASAAEIDELRELNRLMADPSSRYWKGSGAEGLQRRWRELYDRGVRSDDARPTAPDQVNERIPEIEQLMRNTSSEYHRGPNAAALQQEYRDLIDQRERLRTRS